jgi:NADH dehydrogenase [ubiquinone] 1 alpha subcomplex assembly factor 7
MAGAPGAAGALDGLSSDEAASLKQLLLRQIATSGPMTVAEYMALALNHTRFGYYATRDPFGAAGDFTTAPEISQIFGELIGLWCGDLWQRMGAPDPVLLVELGPGRGTLMADALRAAQVLPPFRQALQLHLVETSPLLRQRQAISLAGVPVAWHEDVSTLPAGPMLLIANEFLDALPVRQLVRASHGWHERRVGATADGLSLDFALDPAPSPAEASLPGTIRDAPPGSVFEFCPAALALADALARRFASVDGAALFIDYGYFPGGCGETLQAVQRHRPCPVLSEPGHADLTAHVDFEAFATVAQAAGAVCHGPVTQASFLERLGIEPRAERLRQGASDVQAAAITRACRRLTHPDEMGRLFKVLALTSPAMPVPAGFA